MNAVMPQGSYLAPTIFPIYFGKLLFTTVTIDTTFVELSSEVKKISKFYFSEQNVVSIDNVRRKYKVITVK